MSDDQSQNQQTTETSSALTWYLMVFDTMTNKLVTHIPLSPDQAAALKPHFGVVNEGGDESHFGMYPVKEISLFAEEHMAYD